MRTIITVFLSIALAMCASNVNAAETAATELSSHTEKASLCISNRSEYSLTIKVMRTNSGGLYSTLTIPAKSSRTVYFSQSGSFYIKMKAEKGLETLYKQDSPFSIQCDSFGYTEATLSYYVSSYGGSAGHSISRSEFEKNY